MAMPSTGNSGTFAFANGTVANNQLADGRMTRPARLPAHGGFTLVELALTAAVLAVVLLVLGGAVGYVRDQGMSQFTRDVLERTMVALADYHARTGRYPPDRFVPGWLSPTASHRPRTEGIECMVATLSADQAGTFWKLPAFARALANTDADSSTIDTEPLNEIIDGWGRPLLYYHGYGARPDGPGSPIPAIEGTSQADMARLNGLLADRWAMSGRRPLLDSAGPDGWFGNSDDIRPAQDPRFGEEHERATSRFD